jgi:hypothetical protein
VDQAVQVQPVKIDIPSYKQAWAMVTSQLRSEMSRADFESVVQSLQPMDFRKGVYTVGAVNPYTRDWVDSRLHAKISHILEGLYLEKITLRTVITNDFYHNEAPTESSLPLPALDEESEDGVEKKNQRGQQVPPRTRKVMLERAYCSKRASIIQPERTLMVTMYFFNNWMPLIGHSAMAVILAARSMCYWNPKTGELRNTVETEMAELAKRAAVSVRTVKDVLAMELVQSYFLRYKVRRMMTPNGVRTAGIWMQVRMDDPLTPEDQAAHDLDEEERWYSAEFEVED